MRLYLGGHLNFHHPQRRHWLEVEIDQPTPLNEVLTQLSIPFGDVYLVILNGHVVDLQETIVSAQDEVKLYSAVGGG